MMIMCEIDGNAVLVEPMKNKTEEEMVETYQIMIDRLKTGGSFPKKHILDNEISEKYKNQLRKMECIGNWCRSVFAEETLPKKQHKHLKAISNQSYAGSPTIFHSTNGIHCYRRQS